MTTIAVLGSFPSMPEDLERALPADRVVRVERGGPFDVATDTEVALGAPHPDLIEGFLGRAPRLSWLHTVSAGVERLLIPAVVERKGFTLTNNSGPYDVPIAEFVLATMLAALESSEGLARSWANLTVGSLAASNLISLLTSHDLTVAGAAAQGRDADYEAALVTLATAVGMLDEATEARDRLANTTDVVTLDEWIRRNRHYDEALIALYSALRDSGGLVNDAVREAYREEGEARANLPPDTRGLVVIVADIGRGGLNQAVIAIEQARGRLNLIIEALAPAETSLAPAGSGGA